MGEASNTFRAYKNFKNSGKPLKHRWSAFKPAYGADNWEEIEFQLPEGWEAHEHELLGKPYIRDPWGTNHDYWSMLEILYGDEIPYLIGYGRGTDYQYRLYGVGETMPKPEKSIFTKDFAVRCGANTEFIIYFPEGLVQFEIESLRHCIEYAKKTYRGIDKNANFELIIDLALSMFRKNCVKEYEYRKAYVINFEK